MLNAEVLTFQEFVMHEPLPLSKIQGAILEFLQGREDAVLFGAQAVNAYVSEPRATQDVDIMSNRAHEFAEELRAYIADKFHIAVRVREIRDKGLRIYQTRKEGNRHLVDVRVQAEFPGSQTIDEIRVLTPPELIASKATAFISRYGQEKSWTDRRDLTALLRRFPDLKVKDGEVESLLVLNSVDAKVVEFWHEMVDQDLAVIDEDSDLSF